MKVNLKRNSWSLILFGSLIFFSCDTKLTYETFRKVDETAWNYHNVQQFIIPIQEEENLRMSIALRNTAAYQKANIWLFLTLQSPSGKEQRDTLNCLLADDYGYWLGSGFSGLYLTEHPISEVTRFNEKGDWKLTITHGMRDDNIKGIKEVGVLLRKEN